MKLLPWLACFALLPAWAGEPGQPAGTLIEFRVELQKSVPNDLGRATAYAELTGSDPGDVGRKVKAVLGDALATAKAQPGIVVKSGATQSFPVYAKGGRTLEAWRMRAELLLESRDSTALSAALGKLPAGMAIGSLAFMPSPDARRQAEDDITLEALTAFQAKAQSIAATLKRAYRIRQMSVNGGSHFPTPMPVMRAAAMMADAAPMPVEAGESNVTVTINGQIELLD